MEGNNNGNFYTSLDQLANDFVEYADADVRARYRDNPLEYFKKFHGFILPPILDWIFRKIYDMAKDSVDNGVRSNGLDIIICAARGSGKSLFASMLEFALWYFLDSDCLNAAGSLHKDTAIITNRGSVPISDVVVGDMVVCSDGRWHNVLGRSVTNIGTPWVQLRVFGSNIPTILTVDHKVLTQRGFVSAGELTQADYVILQGNKEQTYIPTIEWDIPNNCSGKYRIKLNKLMNMSFHEPDFYRLIGYYLAEGCSGGSNSLGKNHGSIVFSLSADNDGDIIADLKTLIPRYMLCDVKIEERPLKRESVTMVRCASPAFRNFFGQFGADAMHKKLPYEWLAMDNEYIRQLVRGMWLGDGHIRRTKNLWNYERSEAGYTTTSQQLAIWVRMALAKLGIASSISKQKVPSINMASTKKFKNTQPYRYNISVYGSAFYKLMTEVLNKDVSWVWNRTDKPYDVFGYEKSRCDGDKILYKVKSVVLLEECFDHYDIQVEGIHDFCTLNGVVHNSEDQASIVYSYTCSYIDNDAKVSSVVDKRTISVTNKKGPAPTPVLKCLTSSPKSLRGHHPGALRKAPGLLVLDEAAVIVDGLMKQALPMTKEARPPFNLIISTFHHAFGDFQDFWDNAEARGFLKISMDSFDVCEKCIDDCTKCIPEFDETYCQLICGCYFNFEIPREQLPMWVRFHYQERLDETRLDQKPANCIYPKLCNECPQRETCGAIKVKIKQPGDFGRICEKCGEKVDHKARRSAGHFPVEEVRKAWKRNDKTTFEVEYMGWRPGRGIFVLDPYEIDKAIVPDEQCYYKRGFGSTFLGIDWGAAGTTAMAVVQYMTDEFVNIIAYHSLNAPSDTDCYQLVADLSKQYGISMVLPDSSHVFQNMHMQKELGLVVNPINFTVQKEAGVGAMRMKFERRQVRIPERYRQTLCKDLKNWRRDASGNIIKKNDHGPDALLCAMINSTSFGSAATYFTGDNEEKVRKTYYDRWDQSIF